MKHHVLSLIVLLCYCFSVSAQNVTIAMPVPTPAGDIRQLVALAMQQSRQGNSSLANALGTRADEALPYLLPYIKDPSDQVKMDVSLIASASRTATAMHILAALIGNTNSSAAFDAVSRIYAKASDGDYDGQKIVQWGGQKLKTNLMSLIKRYGDRIEAILLLSYFKNDPAVIHFLRENRRLYPQRRSNINALGLPDSSRDVRVDLATDLALSELGDVKATGRLKKVIARAKIDDLLFLFGNINWINNRAILARMVELLKDKRRARNVAPTHAPPYYARVCDIALKVFQYKTRKRPPSGVYQSFDIYTPQRFSDAELAVAYRRFKVHFTSKRSR